MEFDKIIIKSQEKSYGIVKGSNEVLLIKVGQDAELKGYHDKYIKIAKSLNEKYGISVIVASNHFTGRDPLFDDLDVVEEYAKENNFENYNLKYFGYSNGAVVGAWYGYLHPEIEEMLLVNGPVRISLARFVKGLVNFQGNITLIYGEEDFSHKHLHYVYPYLNEDKVLETIPKADHHFKDIEEEFNLLPEKYLYNNLEKNKASR